MTLPTACHTVARPRVPTPDAIGSAETSRLGPQWQRRRTRIGSPDPARSLAPVPAQGVRCAPERARTRSHTLEATLYLPYGAFMLTGGEVAALVAAVVWAVLATFMCVALVKLIKLINETTKVVSEVGDRTPPLLDDVASTVERTNTSLERVEEITANVQASSEDVSTMTALTRSVFTGPLVRIASFSYAVRQVLGRRKALAVMRGRKRRENR